MAKIILNAAAMAGAVLLTASGVQAEKLSPFPHLVERDSSAVERQEPQSFNDQARRDFIRRGHVNIGVFGGRDRDDRRGPDGYPGGCPDCGCGDCDYGCHDDDWHRKEAKRKAEGEREEAKHYYKQQREADKRYYEQQREAEKRFREQER